MSTSQNNTYSIAFWGTTSFATDILASLHTLYPRLTVVTAPNKPGNRGAVLPNEVAQTAHRLSLPLFQPPSLNDVFFNRFSETRYDISIVVAYGKILPSRFISLPTHGTINIHGSLLPQYRGASPIQTALLNGDATTGITLMRMDEKMDHGPIIAQKELTLLPNDTPHDVFQRITPLAINLLKHHLPALLTHTAHETPQDHSNASYTKLFTRTDGLIDWNKPAFITERMVRAFTPWPGTYSFLEKKRFKILECSVAKNNEEQHSPSGTLLSYRQQGQKPTLSVVTGKDILVLHTIQQEGKKPQDARVVCATHPEIIGKVLQSQ